MLAFSFTSYDNNKLHHLHEFTHKKNLVILRTLNQFIMKSPNCQGFSGFSNKKRMYFFQYILFLFYHFILLPQGYPASSDLLLIQLPRQESLHKAADFRMSNMLRWNRFRLLPVTRYPTSQDLKAAY